MRPYVGSGVVGTRFAELVAAPWSDDPLWTLTKIIYDDGHMLLAPSWTHLDISIAGVPYTMHHGVHRCKQSLDLRTGVASVTDDWEYCPGSFVTISISLVLLRHLPHAGTLNLAMDGLEDEAAITFGLRADHVTDDYAPMTFALAGDTLEGWYTTTVQGREVAQAVHYAGAGYDDARLEVVNNNARVSVKLTGPHLKLSLTHSIHSYADGPDPMTRVRADIAAVSGAPEAALAASGREWRRLWSNALAFDHPDPWVKQMMLAHQFYLLASLGAKSRPMATLGLSADNWRGSQLWDADFYDFRGILPLWPELAAPIVQFRRDTLDAAKHHAAANGYKGAWFAWMTSDTGEDVTNPHYTAEIHLGIWIGLAAWEYFQATGDRAFLADTTWPLVREITDFFVSWATEGDDGKLHLRGVIGPDEALTEYWQGTCDDHFMTVWGMKRLIAAATECAAEVGCEPCAAWKDASNRLYLPPAGEDGIIPEYTGYDGKGIKQADVILAFFPLEYPIDREALLKNLWYYKGKLMPYAPRMTSQIEACLIMRTGQKEQGLVHLF